ncbi:MAG TPA: hypothetical protein VFA33_03595 [Bryobacteraceae bacterium]|nr:hypothetical protein [Bryobacteraceae bacterium]
MPRKLALLLLVAAAGLAWLVAQQPGGIAEINARTAQDRAYQSAYASEPGGTPEANLWEVLVLMGVGDAQPADWDGSVRIAGGTIFSITGYRFELPDRVLPQGGWEMHTKVERILQGSPMEGSGGTRSQVLPKGLLIRGAGNESTNLSLETSHGACSVRPMLLAFGAAQACAGGRIEAKRLPAATDLSGTLLRQHDFPSIAAGGDTLWVTWLSYHDRREELNFRRYREDRWTRLIPVGRATEDLWRPQVAADAQNRPWLIWSEQEKGNWDIYAMAWEDNEWGPRVRLSQDALPDIEPHVARAPDGVIYVVWQAMRGRYSHIYLRYLKDGRWSEAIPVTAGEFDDWEPAVAAGNDGRAWVAWDRYTNNYDVYCRSFLPGSGLSAELPVAATPRFEGHVSIAVDPQNRPWVAWEYGGVNWGKDLGAALGEKSPGTPLGGPRRIGIACLENQVWRAPADPVFHDSLEAGSNSASDPLLFFDPDGNLWMSFKRRYSRLAYRPSTYWETALTRLDGGRWTDPIPLPDSWSRKSTRMSLAAAGGRLWAFWPSESRNYAFASRPLANRVMAGSLVLPGRGRAPRLADFHPPVPDRVPPVHPSEKQDVAAIRAYRVTLGGQSLRIVRGDLHRHTELSQDVGGLDDGSLPEFYRYMIDAAAMDFGASTDHQGGGTDYWNFMTQEMADMYLFPQRFVPLYAYERNLGNPFGHRNILHIQRDYPIVPFFQRIDPRFMLPDSPDGELLTFNSASFGSGIRNDTQLLYEQLRKDGGLAIPHTSASDSMGTDWNDRSDPKLEPLVEIYQGARFSSEARDVPRGVARGQEKKAGYQEGGVVWNAWKKGYRLGVIASSDHYSTHISYAMVYTPEASRRAIFDAIGRRHAYGATDNIILEFWLGSHFMGDDFTASEPQRIRVKARGTGVISAIHLIRDATSLYKWSPNQRDVSFEYLDPAAPAGEHWYYVRVEQADGELAWSSPIWVRYR